MHWSEIRSSLIKHFIDALFIKERKTFEINEKPVQISICGSFLLSYKLINPKYYFYLTHFHFVMGLSLEIEKFYQNYSHHGSAAKSYGA